MNYEIEKIQATLKQLMKQNKMTYESLGKSLKTSPATIKRRLNGDDLSLNQLKQFAQIFSLTIYELIELSNKIQRAPHTFTDLQEKELSSDLSKMMCFRLIVAGFSFAQIEKELSLPARELRRIAKKFEEIGLARLLPGDRFSLMVHYPFRWQPQGALAKTYDSLILKNIFRKIQNRQADQGFYRDFEFAFSAEIFEKFCAEIEDVYAKYSHLSEIHLNRKIQMDECVSGVFFIDRFSVWDTKDQTLSL